MVYPFSFPTSSMVLTVTKAILSSVTMSTLANRLPVHIFTFPSINIWKTTTKTVREIFTTLPKLCKLAPKLTSVIPLTTYKLDEETLS